jgi:hypothetical protein
MTSTEGAAADGTIGPVRPLVLEDPAAASVDRGCSATTCSSRPCSNRARGREASTFRAARCAGRVTVAADGTLAPTGDVHRGDDG